MKIPQITLPIFFKVGRLCFIVIAIANSFNLLWTYQLMNAAGLISSLTSIIFNFVTAGFFHYMLSQSQESSLQDTSNEELKELVDNFGK